MSSMILEVADRVNPCIMDEEEKEGLLWMLSVMDDEIVMMNDELVMMNDGQDDEQDDDDHNG